LTAAAAVRNARRTSDVALSREADPVTTRALDEEGRMSPSGTASRVRGIAVALALLVGAGGCGAVLTRSQVDEIRTFGTAAEGYRSLPAGVITAYADVRFEREVLATSSVTQPDEYLRGLRRALDFREKLRAQAQRANDALAILEVYAHALAALASDEPTEALTKSATDFGKSLDRLVTQYNDRHKANLGLVGGAAAAIVRGAGGLFIRHEQAELLRHYVTAADPMVQQLTRDVDNLMEVFQAPKDAPAGDVGSLAFEQEQYERLITGTVRLHPQPGTLPLSTALAMAGTLEDIRLAIALAQSVPKASAAYRAAHAKLRKAVETRATLTEGIAEVTTLVDEIKAAQTVLKSLKR
jgi:hypothetical protein